MEEQEGPRRDWDCLYALSQRSLVNVSGQDVESPFAWSMDEYENPNQLKLSMLYRKWTCDIRPAPSNCASSS